MMLDVAIARAQLDIRGAIALAADPKQFVNELLEEAERRLDLLALPLEGDLVIPQLELNIQVVSRSEDLAQAIGAALADAIMSSLRSHVPTSPAPSSQHGSVGASAPLSIRARHLLQSAVLAAARPPRGAAATSVGANDEPVASDEPRNDGHSLIEKLVRASRPTAVLGALARLSRTRDLQLLAQAEAITVLRNVRAELLAGGVSTHSSDAPTIDARVVTSYLALLYRRADERLAGSETAIASCDAATAVTRLLVAIAEAARPGRVVAPNQLLDEVRRVLDATRRTDRTSAAASTSVPDAAPDRPARTPEDGAGSSQAQTSANPQSAQARIAEAAAETTLEHCCIHSPVAGLSLMLAPLLDLGFDSALRAVRSEPTFCRFAVLQRLLELTVSDPPSDPAIAILAGLLALPRPDDLELDAATWTTAQCSAFARAAGGDAQDYAGMVDAWARALLEETRARLADPELAAAIGPRVIATAGLLALADEQLTVTMPFTDAYEPLLRAGLLSDVPTVPWLEGRALRFVFVEDL